MARPTKLTANLQAQLIELLEAGNHVETACACAGIGSATFYRWMASGELPNARREFREFREAIKKAQAMAESNAVAVVMAAAQGGNWQAAMTWLERSRPDRWAKRSPQSLDNPSFRVLARRVEEDHVRIEGEHVWRRIQDIAKMNGSTPGEVWTDMLNDLRREGPGFEDSQAESGKQ